jgi:hypothetical protein
MIAAIYACKSTDQTAVADDQKSVTRQIESAGRLRPARAGRSTRLALMWTMGSPAPSLQTGPGSCG